jgi:hypothetical protein
MIINFDEFVADTEGVVGRMLEFVGADTKRVTFKPLPPGMKVWWAQGWAPFFLELFRVDFSLM